MQMREWCDLLWDKTIVHKRNRTESRCDFVISLKTLNFAWRKSRLWEHKRACRPWGTEAYISITFCVSGKHFLLWFLCTVHGLSSLPWFSLTIFFNTLNSQECGKSICQTGCYKPAVQDPPWLNDRLLCRSQWLNNDDLYFTPTWH